MSMKTKVQWVGENPKECKLCNVKIDESFVDGVIRGKGWGVMCSTCHNSFGFGLGTGKGQRYRRYRDGFVKVEG